MAARIRAYTPEELNKKKTIHQGSYGDLKVDTGRYRVWFWPQTNSITYQALYQNKWTECNPDGSFV